MNRPEPAAPAASRPPRVVLLGAGFAGDRLSKLYRKSANTADIKDLLRPVITDYAKNRNEGERFGDFVLRAGYVMATEEGRDFHKDFIDPEEAAVSA